MAAGVDNTVNQINQALWGFVQLLQHIQLRAQACGHNKPYDVFLKKELLKIYTTHNHSNQF